MKRTEKAPPQFGTSAVLLDGDAPRRVLRAHAIADTIKALLNAEVFEQMQPGQRDAVAAELAVPALWIDAAACDGMAAPRVSLGLLEEYRTWREALPPTKKGGK